MFSLNWQQSKLQVLVCKRWYVSKLAINYKMLRTWIEKKLSSKVNYSYLPYFVHVNRSCRGCCESLKQTTCPWPFKCKQLLLWVFTGAIYKIKLISLQEKWILLHTELASRCHALHVCSTPDSCLLPRHAAPSLYMWISSFSLSSELLAPYRHCP